MKAAILILWLAAVAATQTRTRPCTPPTPSSAENTPAIRATVAAKPANTVAGTPVVLPQIQYHRVPPAPPPSCWCGTVPFTALSSPSPSQEILTLSGLPGRFRFDHVLLQEVKPFASDLVSRLTVSLGRPNSDGEIISTFDLKSPTAPENFAYRLVTPPAIRGTYDLVLKFVGSSPLAIDGSSNFSAGSLNWEVCGGQV